MPSRRIKAIRVVSVTKPVPPKPKLPPYNMHQNVAFYHPEHGQYRGEVVSINFAKDEYKVRLRSGSVWTVQGSWIKTGRPEA